MEAGEAMHIQVEAKHCKIALVQTKRRQSCERRKKGELQPSELVIQHMGGQHGTRSELTWHGSTLVGLGHISCTHTHTHKTTTRQLHFCKTKEKK